MSVRLLRPMRSTFILGLFALVAIASPAMSMAQTTQFLVHETSGLCVDVSGAPGVNNGAVLQLWACETTGTTGNGAATDQKWYLQNGFVRNGVTGKCIDVSGAPGVAPGSKLQLWDCELGGRGGAGATDQQWDVSNGQFRNRVSGLCMGPQQTSYRNGTPLVLTPCAKPGAADLAFSFRAPGGGMAKSGPPTQAPAPVAATSKARMIYPDAAGASQTCVMPVDEKTRRPSNAAMAVLMLVACPQSNNTPFVVANRQIKLASNPNLCVAVAGGAHSATLYLEECKDTNVPAWEASGSSTQAARVRVAAGIFENQCWSIPKLADPANPRLPYELVLKDCGRNDLKLFVE